MSQANQKIHGLNQKHKGMILVEDVIDICKKVS